MKRRIAIAVMVAVMSIATAAPAFAAPSFGPGAGNGQGNNGPQDPGAKCHPPGQTVDTPGCK